MIVIEKFTAVILRVVLDDAKSSSSRIIIVEVRRPCSSESIWVGMVRELRPENQNLFDELWKKFNEESFIGKQIIVEKMEDEEFILELP